MAKYKKIYHLKSKEIIEFECDTEETWEEIQKKYSHYVGIDNAINLEQSNSNTKLHIIPSKNIEFMELIKED